ncbi:MAG TPA: aldo/keto reductase [Clostridiales bacterium]|nr:aldo/keto reductase [Clostridiales bacterium]
MFEKLEDLNSRVKLHNGEQMPVLGLGVWQMQDGDEVRSSVKFAIEHGYRLIDTAAVYHNESGVGQAIKESGVDRESLFITTKVWNSDHGYDTTLRAFERSLRKLQLEYIDLYLIHWPGKYKFKDTWRAMEKLYKEGRVKAIGVSNFQTHHLDELIDSCEIIPMVNQVEYHPLLSQVELKQYCKRHKIQLEAWSPLMQGRLDLPVLKQLAEKYGKTPAQIVLRWDLQNGVVTIPKSVHPERIVENSQVFDFELSEDDMELIDNLNENRRFGGNPDVFF